MLEEGDFILAVNGVRTNTLKHDVIVDLLRGASDDISIDVEYVIPDTRKLTPFLSESSLIRPARSSVMTSRSVLISLTFLTLVAKPPCPFIFNCKGTCKLPNEEVLARIWCNEMGVSGDPPLTLPLIPCTYLHGKDIINFRNFIFSFC